MGEHWVVQREDGLAVQPEDGSAVQPEDEKGEPAFTGKSALAVISNTAL